MADFTAKRGDLLSDLEVGLLDRDDAALDLSAATEVRIYMRAHRSSTNIVDGELCSVPDAAGGLVKAPAIPLEVAGNFLAYFKVAFGSEPKRVPSQGYLTVEVQDSFE